MENPSLTGLGASADAEDFGELTFDVAQRIIPVFEGFQVMTARAALAANLDQFCQDHHARQESGERRQQGSPRTRTAQDMAGAEVDFPLPNAKRFEAFGDQCLLHS